MSKLLERAKIKRINAENDFLYISTNDAYVDDCCYNLEQAIELSLKYLIELNGERYKESHDIRLQMNKLNDMNIDYPCKDKLRFMASTINSWEAESRYNDNFTALIEDILEARIISNSLIDYCDSLIKVIHEMHLDSKPYELIKNNIKTVEMRLNDEKRKDINEGDLIKFVNDNNESILVIIKKKNIFKNFKELYKNYNKTSLGYLENEEANYEDMYKYYSKENIEKYGVIAFEIKLYK